MSELSLDDGCVIVQRGCCLGAAWGAVIGILMLAVLALADHTPAELVLFPFAALVGAVLGALAGTASGMTLGFGEMLWQPNDRQRRTVAAVTSGVVPPFIVVWASAGDPGFVPFLVGVGLTGAVAGAVLAPRVVHGSRHRTNKPA
jgi:hypothetical protein